MIWVAVKDGDPVVREKYHNHYSYRKRSIEPKLCVGPGEKLVLLAIDHSALFIWGKFKSDNGQDGVNCAVFQNNGKHKSSDLILQAEEFAKLRWPGERLYTYVDSNKIKSINPGCCFKKAGWKKIGTTKVNKLDILEKFWTNKV